MSREVTEPSRGIIKHIWELAEFIVLISDGEYLI